MTVVPCTMPLHTVSHYIRSAVAARRERRTDVSTPAINNSPTHQESADFQNDACNIGNQAGRQTINGGLHNHL
jgi:hypothetical protein